MLDLVHQRTREGAIVQIVIAIIGVISVCVLAYLGYVLLKGDDAV